MAKRAHTTSGALIAAAVALLSLGAVACEPLPPAPPGGTAPDCSDIRWGSGAKTAARMATDPILEVRAGEHRCYDRLVIEVDGPFGPGWVVGYGTVEEPGTGDPVPVRGGADLEVIVRAPVYTDTPEITYDPPNPSEAVDVTGFDTFRQVAYVGSFEGQTTFGLGVRARLPFRVFALEGPEGSRLVVDVAHRWP